MDVHEHEALIPLLLKLVDENIQLLKHTLKEVGGRGGGRRVRADVRGAVENFLGGEVEVSNTVKEILEAKEGKKLEKGGILGRIFGATLVGA